MTRSCLYLVFLTSVLGWERSFPERSRAGPTGYTFCFSSPSHYETQGQDRIIVTISSLRWSSLASAHCSTCSSVLCCWRSGRLCQLTISFFDGISLIFLFAVTNIHKSDLRQGGFILAGQPIVAGKAVVRADVDVAAGAWSSCTGITYGQSGRWRAVLRLLCPFPVFI